MRTICHTIYAMNTTSKQPMPPSTFMPFSFDVNPPESITTPEEKAAMSQRAMELARLLPKK